MNDKVRFCCFNCGQFVTESPRPVQDAEDSKVFYAYCKKCFEDEILEPMRANSQNPNDFIARMKAHFYIIKNELDAMENPKLKCRQGEIEIRGDDEQKK